MPNYTLITQRLMDAIRTYTDDSQATINWADVFDPKDGPHADSSHESTTQSLDDFSERDLTFRARLVATICDDLNRTREYISLAIFNYVKTVEYDIQNDSALLTPEETRFIKSRADAIEAVLAGGNEALKKQLLDSFYYSSHSLCHDISDQCHAFQKYLKNERDNIQEYKVAKAQHEKESMQRFKEAITCMVLRGCLTTADFDQNKTSVLFKKIKQYYIDHNISINNAALAFLWKLSEVGDFLFDRVGLTVVQKPLRHFSSSEFWRIVSPDAPLDPFQGATLFYHNGAADVSAAFEKLEGIIKIGDIKFSAVEKAVLDEKNYNLVCDFAVKHHDSALAKAFAKTEFALYREWIMTEKVWDKSLTNQDIFDALSQEAAQLRCPLDVSGLDLTEVRINSEQHLRGAIFDNAILTDAVFPINFNAQQTQSIVSLAPLQDCSFKNVTATHIVFRDEATNKDLITTPEALNFNLDSFYQKHYNRPVPHLSAHAIDKANALDEGREKTALEKALLKIQHADTVTNFFNPKKHDSLTHRALCDTIAALGKITPGPITCEMTRNLAYDSLLWKRWVELALQGSCNSHNIHKVECSNLSTDMIGDIYAAIGHAQSILLIRDTGAFDKPPEIHPYFSRAMLFEKLASEHKDKPALAKDLADLAKFCHFIEKNGGTVTKESIAAAQQTKPTGRFFASSDGELEGIKPEYIKRYLEASLQLPLDTGGNAMGWPED